MSSKLTALTELTSITDTTDLVYMVDAPGTTPVSRKTQISTLKRDLFNNVEIQITATTHGFVSGDVGKPIAKYSAGTYAFAQSDTQEHVETVGVMSAYIDANTFKVVHSGKFTKTSHGYTGPVVFISPTVAGGLTETVPITDGQFIKPIAKVIDANTLEIIDYPAIRITSTSNTSSIVSNAYEWAGTTTDATQTEIFLNGLTNNRYTVAANSQTGFMFFVTARDSSNNCRTWRIEGGIKRDGSNNTAILGSTLITGISKDTGTDSWSVDGLADDTNEALVPKVTGVAATTITWKILGLITNTSVASGAAAPSNIEIIVTTSTAHGFVVADINKPVSKLSNGTYVLSTADTLANIETVGVISAYISTTQFKIIQIGKITVNAHGYTGPVVMVSPTVAGGLTETVPTTAGQFIKPIFKVIDANTLEVLDYQAVQVVAVNNSLPDTNITLSDETTKNVSNTTHGFMTKVGVSGTVPISTGTAASWVIPNYNKNKVVNGNFFSGGWQRGTSLSAGTGARYLADMWKTTSAGTTATNAPSQQAFTVGQTDVPYEPEFFHQTVVVAGTTDGSLTVLVNCIEDVRTLAGQTAILSFYAKADASKNVTTELVQSFGTGGSAVVTGISIATHALTTAWTKYTAQITFPSISGKTIVAGHHLELTFWLDAGATHNARSNTLGHQAGTFSFAQVQLEAGSIATPFEQRPYAVEKILCFRHCYKASFSAYASTGLRGFYGKTNGAGEMFFDLPVAMYSTPAFSFSGALWVYDGTDAVDVSTLTLRESPSPYTVVFLDFTSSAFTAAKPVWIIGNNAAVGSYILFTAEI